MNSECINIKEILEFMDTGRAFSLTFVTADRRKGTGGQLISYPRAVKTIHDVKDGTKVSSSTVIHSEAKSPNHSEHFTRNILLPNRTVRKIHIDLITRFNGKNVL